MKRFLALFDLHWGFERKNRHKVPIHDLKALDIVARFAEEFKPEIVIWGGDILDCGAVSHHNRKKRLAIEDLRLAEDAEGLRIYRKQIVGRSSPEEFYFIGNHEDWLHDVVEEYPALDGILSVEALLGLPSSTKVIPQGGTLQLGKLVFAHGDQIKGGMHIARKAVDTYARNIRFGHYHTYQAATRCSPIDQADVHTAVAVPCLCRRDLAYSEGSPNSWAQGFLWGHLDAKGYSDQVAIISKRGLVALGKHFQ